MESEQSGIIDRQQVVDVCTRYALALDSRDWELLTSCFIPDAVANYGGQEPARGVDAIVETCRSTLSPLSASQHLLGNHLVTVQGDEADSVCYFQAQHVKPGLEGGPNFIVAGRYEDRLIRTPTGWRIAERTLKVMWTDGNAAVLGMADLS